jgi:hypothetical protein
MAAVLGGQVKKKTANAAGRVEHDASAEGPKADVKNFSQINLQWLRGLKINFRIHWVCRVLIYTF